MRLITTEGLRGRHCFKKPSFLSDVSVDAGHRAVWTVVQTTKRLGQKRLPMRRIHEQKQMWAPTEMNEHWLSFVRWRDCSGAKLLHQRKGPNDLRNDHFAFIPLYLVTSAPTSKRTFSILTLGCITATASSSAPQKLRSNTLARIAESAATEGVFYIPPRNF